MNNQKSMIMATVLATVLYFAAVPIVVQAVPEDDGEFVANPYCDKVPDGYQGDCHDRKDASDSTGLYTCNTGIHVEDWKDCKDASDD